MTRSSSKKPEPTRRARSPVRPPDTERWSLHEMPTLPPQVLLPGDEGYPAAEEPRADITSLLPAPPLHAGERYLKVTAYLTTRQVAFLRSLSTVIRGKSGIFVTQSELLRAMVDSVLEGGVDLSDATCEADLKRLLLAQHR